MPEVTSKSVPNSNVGDAYHYFGDALLHSVSMKFSIFEITLNSGNKVILKFTRNATGESSPFNSVEIY